MGNDLGVGVTGKLVTAVGEPRFEFDVVLDDPVVDDSDVFAVRVRVCVRVGRRPVGAPARMADTNLPSSGVSPIDAFSSSTFPDRFWMSMPEPF